MSDIFKKLGRIERQREAKMRRMDHPMFHYSDVEDIVAPHGRCYECRRPFGMMSEDGMVVYKAYSTEEEPVCTECIYDGEEG